MTGTSFGPCRGEIVPLSASPTLHCGGHRGEGGVAVPPTGALADEEAPQLLSPELAASLGVAGGDAMLTSAKKKQKPGGGGGA